MPSNTTLNPGASGDVMATKQRTHDGDTTKVQVVTLAGVSGTEDSYTFGDVGGDATNGLDVDVTRVIPGTSATHLGKAVDSAAGSTDTGVALLAVRDDALTTLTPTDGDYTNLRVDSTGALHVRLTAGGVSGIADDAAFTPGTTEGVMFFAELDDTSPDSVDEGDGGALRMSANRNLYVRIRDNAGNERGLNIDTNGALAATVTNATASNLNAQVVGAAAADAAVSGNPVYVAGRGSNTTPTAMSAQNDVTPLWLTLAGATVVSGDVVDDAAFTPGTSRVVPIAFQADETATDSVDEGDAGAPRMTLDRKVITTPYVHAAAGGHSPFRSLDVDETEDEVKGSAGKLFWIHAMNMTAAVVYLKVYNNTAAGTTVGTTTPVLTFPIPTMGDTNGAGFTISFGDAGLAFSTGICVAGTTGLADNDTTGVGTNGLFVNAGFI